MAITGANVVTTVVTAQLLDAALAKTHQKLIAGKTEVQEAIITISMGIGIGLLAATAGGFVAGGVGALFGEDEDETEAPFELE